MAWPHAPSSYLPNLGLSDCFLFPSMEKVLNGKHFANVDEMKQQQQQKHAEALKGIKIGKFRKFWAVEKNVSIGVLHQMESTLKVTEV